MIFKENTIFTMVQVCCANFFQPGNYNLFCLSDTGKTTTIVGNQLSLFLHYYKNGIIETFIRDNLFGYRYCYFHFDPFNKVAPKFYIEKNNAKDIIISSSKYASLIN